ncbi:MAG: hypothetical protein AAFS03_11645, partial [Pseudomonadota bacterium]
GQCAGLRIGLRRAGLDPKHFSWPPEDEPNRSPYRGLQALLEKDAAVFFGRDARITAGLDELRQMRGGDPKRVLTIAAASGAGKSSFLHAGLLSRLSRDAENFLILPVMRPGRDALSGAQGLLNALSLNDPPEQDSALIDHLERLRTPVVAQFRALAEAANETYDRPAPTLVLPLDQAEELFSIDNVSGQAALDLLIRALNAFDDLVIVATIRSDSLGALQADARIAGKLKLFNLPALPASSFREVIEGPAAIAQPPIEIEPALTDRLISDLGEDDALPLLAFTLERLVADYGDDHVLELDEYLNGLGGVSGAINSAVDAAFARALGDPLLPDDRDELDELARAAFIPWLVQLDDAGASPKRRQTPTHQIPNASRPLLQHFVSERLLVSTVDVETRESVLEVSHEA